MMNHVHKFLDEGEVPTIQLWKPVAKTSKRKVVEPSVPQRKQN